MEDMERKFKKTYPGKKTYTEQKTHRKNSVTRMVIMAVAFFLQLGWLIFLFFMLNQYYVVVNVLFTLVAAWLVLYIYGMHENASVRMSWVIVLLIAPVLGVVLYFLFGNRFSNRRMRRRFDEVTTEFVGELSQDEQVMEELRRADRHVANQCRYIHRATAYPVYRGADVTFYPEASLGFEAQLAALAEAKEFIFMEYYCFEDADAFERLRAVLQDRVAHGVEVRMLYDDVGCVGHVDNGFDRRVEKMGIACRVFNPIRPFLDIFMNNRDHRKITVIDGRIAFTGGYNIGDQYFNLTHPFGYWKDSGVRIAGEAVRSFTVMFLEMWNSISETDQDYGRYLKSVGTAQTCSKSAGVAGEERACSDVAGEEHGRAGIPGKSGYVQPYADSPLDNEYVAENVYLNIAKTATDYLYITTPYLVISDEMRRELCLAAERGVDVRIVTPGIPDKKTIYHVTRSYYAGLVKRGVRIYEYTPGFLHAKQTLSDDIVGTVGTINFDFRSLYHHFEDGVFLYDCEALQDIKADFEKLFADSAEVTEKYRTGRNTVLKITQCILRLFAPLL